MRVWFSAQHGMQPTASRCSAAADAHVGRLSVHTLNDRYAMKSSSKVILVVAGYLVAFVIASVVVGLYVATTNGPDRQTYGGMFAFGDSLLFLGVCAVAAIPATGAALFFLRPHHLFWRLLAAGALGMTAIALADLVGFLGHQTAATDSFLGAWSNLSPPPTIGSSAPARRGCS